MNAHSVWYSSQNACRLPLYLSEANRNEEAWTLFGDVLKKSDRHTLGYVLDKMRLFLQRNGKVLESVKYGVMAHIAEMRNVKKLLSEGVDVNPSPMGKEQIEKLLKKAKRPELINEVDSVSKKHYARLPNLDLDCISRDMNDVLYKDSVGI
jgi:hypothetical protein